MNLYIPILIVVLSNTIYHICAKSTPEGANTFAGLTVTYLVGAVASYIIYAITAKSGNVIAEYRNLNWTCVVLGLAIIGLEAGNILMYKVGWNVNSGQIVQAAFLSIVLLFVGFLMYKETITGPKILGVLICLIGMYLINK